MGAQKDKSQNASPLSPPIEPVSQPQRKIIKKDPVYIMAENKIIDLRIILVALPLLVRNKGNFLKANLLIIIVNI